MILNTLMVISLVQIIQLRMNIDRIRKNNTLCFQCGESLLLFLQED